MATDEQIRELAYFIWKREGCMDGKHSEHYFRAKRILEDQEAIAKEEASENVEAVSGGEYSS